MANRNHAHRFLQCLVVAIRPLRVEELADILALDFEEAEGATPTLNKDWRWQDRQQAVLSTCSSLITLVDDGGFCVIQFSHFSVKEFLTSERLASSKGDTSHLHITVEPAHTTVAQACLGSLLQLDGRLNKWNNYRVEHSFPLARYASQHWVEHAQFGMVSSRIVDGMRRLFDSGQPYFSAWLLLYDLDKFFPDFGKRGIAHRGSPLYYASLCGFHDLAAYIIAEYPEQVNARGGHNRTPLGAALHKRHFDVAELLCQHGAAVNDLDIQNRLHVASVNGLIDVVRWLLGHGVDADLQDDELWTPIIIAAANGHLEVVRTLLGRGVNINAATDCGWTALRQASYFGHVEIGALLLQHGADVGARDKDSWTPLHLASFHGQLGVVTLLLDHAADVEARERGGRTPLHLALSTSSGGAAIVRLLLNCGANANAQDKYGRTPLHLVTATGAETVRLLLDGGARVDVKDNEGWTPLEVMVGGSMVAQILAERHA